MHPSIANLSSRLHLCSGDVPPPLVGASATLVESTRDGIAFGAKIYLFGGRLVSSRRMVNILYCLDLDEMKWSRISPATKSRSEAAETSEQPQPRYFHSADLWQDKILFFGGMGYSQRPEELKAGEPAEELCVLDELLAFDLTSQQWDYSFNVAAHRSTSEHDAGSSSQADTLRPAPRYAHLSSLSGDTLSIIGGQNLANQYVESVNLFSLSQNSWIGAQRLRKQCGSYRSLAVGAKYLYKDGEKAKCYPRAKDPLNSTDGTASTPVSSTSGPAPHSASSPQNGDAVEKLGKVEQNLLPMSCPPEANQTLPVYLYSNYNFTDVRRELEVLTLRPEADPTSEAGRAQQRARSISNASQESAIDVEGPLTPSQSAATSSSSPLVSIEDRSHHMGGVTLPPGLRFPTGALLGPYLLISGTYLANATQSFSIWALHLPTMVWSRIESGSALSTGSWNRALLWPGKNRLVVVGHKERDLVSDYNHRQTNWDHVVVLELEAWGIYQPPLSVLSEAAIQLGLDKLASTAPSAMATARALARGAGVFRPDEKAPTASSAETEANLEEPMRAPNLGGRGDFEIVCSDGLRIGCDRAILEARWPWFKVKMDEFRKKARRTLRIAYPAAQDPFSLRIIPEDIAEFLAEDDTDDEPVDPLVLPSANSDGMPGEKQKLMDPRFQPRHLQISEPSPVVLALLQFVYTLRICTALQRHPAVVCALMVLARTYQMEDLASWARHAAHVALAEDLNPKNSLTYARHGGALSPSSSITHAIDGTESSGLEVFRPAEALGLHPEERHRLAVCLYEAASLCGCEGLQIRALRVVMAIARWLQKHGAGPSTGGGSGNGLEKQGQGRNDGPSRDRSGSTSHYAGGSNGASASHSAGGQSRGGSSSNYRAATGGILGAAPSPLLQMPSPVPSMSRAGSDAASSQGPLTPNSIYQTFLDQRGGSFSSSTDASPSSLAFINGIESLDEQSGPEFRKMSSTQGLSGSRLEKYAAALSLQEQPSISTITTPSMMVAAASEIEPTEVTTSTTMRKRFSLFGRNTTSNTPSLADAPTFEQSRAGSSLGFVDSLIGNENVRVQMEEPQGASLLDHRISASANDGITSNQLSPPLLSSDDWSNRFKLPRHSIASRDVNPASSSSSALNSPALTMDPKQRHLQLSSATSSPSSEQFAVNSYGPRSEQDQVSRSTSISDASGASNSLHRSDSNASRHVSTPLGGIEISRDVSHLSPKEIAKLGKEERKRAEKEEKQRKKAEKAEYKRLAAEAVFGPKGSAGPSPAPETSDFAMYTAGAQVAGGESSTGTSSSRRSSEPSDSRSGTSTASPRTGSSLRTAYSPRSPATTAPAKRGEWSVTTANTASPWFSAPPPMMAPAGLKAMPKGNKSVHSLSGKSSARSR
ncbi:related to Ral2 protein, implicated in activation of ras1 [Melanopsichium pennsylvanicum]|uniref:Related to Ral2 protein, implicated in activation of ras1 n=2 Tax=Melanopsichium pennsylvanicum TaxID=63383 RepID=A0AAJ4XHK7_9BASI|nr:related to Ral2 protein, implicated in activation of ras1 [Melanopsichium pennsylvanicum 4]SNX82255.1 related to Ral2 protein, implicated in activation of ras1 [Melanopsichium pennsylvanicum]